MPHNRGCSQYLILVSEELHSSAGLLEVLFKFDKPGPFGANEWKIWKCSTLRDNPHFYTDLPTSPEAYGDKFEINPTEDIRHADKFYVLTDKPEPVHIMTDGGLQSFGNFWCPKNAIIFKGLGIFFAFPLISDVLLDMCGRLRGQSIIEESLRGTYCQCGSCKRFPVSVVPRALRSTVNGFYKRLLASTIPRASKNRRGLQLIITEGCSRIVWKCSIGCLAMYTSSDDMRLCICTGRPALDSPVRWDINIFKCIC